MAKAKAKTAKPKMSAAPKATSAAPKFGSAAWNAKYGVGKKKNGGK